MTQYAKLINNQLQYINTSGVLVDKLHNIQVFNPKEENYIYAGYKPTESTIPPTITKYQKLQTVYTENDTSIVISYDIVNMTEDEIADVDTEEAQAVMDGE